jgi:cellulose synthase (UDP-forming)
MRISCHTGTFAARSIFADPRSASCKPQHFFNKDPVQWNLDIERVWPDEQRLFFDEMAASRDAWDVSFAASRARSCRKARGDRRDPTESVTEDLLTTWQC